MTAFSIYEFVTWRHFKNVTELSHFLSHDFIFIPSENVNLTSKEMKPENYVSQKQSNNYCMKKKAKPVSEQTLIKMLNQNQSQNVKSKC